MNAKQIFDKAKADLFSTCKFMQEHEEKIVSQLAMDTNAAREISEQTSNIESLIESMVNCNI